MSKFSKSGNMFQYLNGRQNITGYEFVASDSGTVIKTDVSEPMSEDMIVLVTNSSYNNDPTLEKWVIDNCTGKVVAWMGLGGVIQFENKSDAILFKLWC